MPRKTKRQLRREAKRIVAGVGASPMIPIFYEMWRTQKTSLPKRWQKSFWKYYYEVV